MRPTIEETVLVDFEPSVGPGGTLQRLGVRAYVEDPRFDVLGVAIAVGRGDIRFFWLGAARPADGISAACDLLQAQSEVGRSLVAHNSSFAGLVVEKYFGLHFRRTFDTAAYARSLGLDSGLANVARWLGFEKSEAPPFDRNSHRDPTRLAKMATSCMTDVALCREILVHAIGNASFSDIEFDVINHTTQLNLRGVRVGAAQVEMLLGTLRARRDAELEAFARTYVFTTSDIHKTTRVLQFIEGQFGVRMQSLDRKKEDFTRAIEQGGDLAAFLMSRARLQTLSAAVGRAMAYASIPGGRVHGVVRYNGAHTGRFSAGGSDAEKLNLHGLSKGNDLLTLPELALERTVVVPEDGFVFRSSDLASIEARVVAWLAGETALLERFRAGEDVYSWFSGLVFPGVVITKNGANKHRRPLGKESVLGLGFGMGLRKFQVQVRAKQIACERADVERAFATYQSAFPRIKELRMALFAAFAKAANGGATETPLWTMRCAERDGISAPTVAVDLPTGRTLYYRSVRIEQEKTDFGVRPALWSAPSFGGKGKSAPARQRNKRRRFHDGVMRHRLTPQVIVENVVQAIARDLMIHQALELEKLGLPVAWHAHDEVIVSCAACGCTGRCDAVCPWTVAGDSLRTVMTRIPRTLPRLSSLPVDCELNPRVRTTYSV